jgi:hypothetical protein
METFLREQLERFLAAVDTALERPVRVVRHRRHGGPSLWCQAGDGFLPDVFERPRDERQRSGQRGRRRPGDGRDRVGGAIAGTASVPWPHKRTRILACHERDNH